jgi:hypothetical protein
MVVWRQFVEVGLFDECKLDCQGYVFHGEQEERPVIVELAVWRLGDMRFGRNMQVCIGRSVHLCGQTLP